MEPDYWAGAIARNIRAARLAAGMTQSQLAGAIDTTIPAVSRLESGRHLPALRLLLKVAEALGVHPCRLLEAQKEAKPEKGKK